jgi:hypothetical protein
MSPGAVVRCILRTDSGNMQGAVVCVGMWSKETEVRVGCRWECVWIGFKLTYDGQKWVVVD